MRRIPTDRHARGQLITSAVAIHLVRHHACSARDIEWLRAAGARWHPRDGGISLPPGHHPSTTNAAPAAPERP